MRGEARRRGGDIASTVNDELLCDDRLRFEMTAVFLFSERSEASLIGTGDDSSFLRGAFRQEFFKGSFVMRRFIFCKD